MQLTSLCCSPPLAKLKDLKYEVKIKPENMIPKHTLFTDRGECVDCLAEKELIHLKEQGIV